jgi:hypothetical protein
MPGSMHRIDLLYFGYILVERLSLINYQNVPADAAGSLIGQVRHLHYYRRPEDLP